MLSLLSLDIKATLLKHGDVRNAHSRAETALNHLKYHSSNTPTR